MRFDWFAARDPSATAIVDADEAIWTRGAVSTLVNQLSRAMREGGLVEGASTAIMLTNCREYVVSYLAATQIGLFVVPINRHLAPVEVAYILSNSEAKGLG